MLGTAVAVHAGLLDLQFLPNLQLQASWLGRQYSAAGPWQLANVPATCIRLALLTGRARLIFVGACTGVRLAGLNDVQVGIELPIPRCAMLCQ